MAEKEGDRVIEEYISRKAVRDAIASLSIERFELTPAYRLYVEALDNVDKKVVKIPAADVELVRHGKWIPYNAKKCLYTCSECNALPKDKTKYCPNCGAKMDGGKNV